MDENNRLAGTPSPRGEIVKSRAADIDELPAHQSGAGSFSWCSNSLAAEPM